MNPFEMVIGIVLIGTIGSIVRARMGLPGKHERKMRARGMMDIPEHDLESNQMRDEIKMLKERIQVLERVITDTNSATSLDREIEKLR